MFITSSHSLASHHIAPSLAADRTWQAFVMHNHHLRHTGWHGLVHRRRCRMFPSLPIPEHFGVAPLACPTPCPDMLIQGDERSSGVNHRAKMYHKACSCHKAADHWLGDLRVSSAEVNSLRNLATPAWCGSEAPSSKAIAAVHNDSGSHEFVCRNSECPAGLVRNIEDVVLKIPALRLRSRSARIQPGTHEYLLDTEIRNHGPKRSLEQQGSCYCLRTDRNHYGCHQRHVESSCCRHRAADFSQAASMGSLSR